jgi:superfamily II DNA/RNA helicase
VLTGCFSRTTNIVGHVAAITNTHIRSVVVVNSKNSDIMSRQSVESAQIIVGTSCAGTGLDVMQVGQIIVVGLPFSIEQLLQWAGRCRLSGNITIIVPSWHMQGGGELAGANAAMLIFINCSHTCDVIVMGRNHT